MEIPKLEIDAKNRIVIQTKDIPLNVNGKEVLIKIRKLSTGQRNKIESQCTTIKIVNGMQNVTVDGSQVQELILEQAIVEAPFETTVNAIKELPAEVTDYLYREYREFAEPSSKKKD